AQARALEPRALAGELLRELFALRPRGVALGGAAHELALERLALLAADAEVGVEQRGLLLGRLEPALHRLEVDAQGVALARAVLELRRELLLVRLLCARSLVSLRGLARERVVLARTRGELRLLLVALLGALAQRPLHVREPGLEIAEL